MQATEREQDAVVGSLGFRYGLIPRLNLTARVNGTYRNVRTETGETTHTSETGRLTNVSLGLDYRVTSPVSQPFIIGFAQVAVPEDSGGPVRLRQNGVRGADGQLGKGPPHLVRDPNVFAFCGTGFWHAGVSHPGNLVTVAPSVEFATNPDVNLSWGLSFVFRQADTLKGARQGVWRSQPAVTLGMAYSQSRSTVVNVNARAGIGGNNRTQLSVFVTHRFNQ